MIVTVNHALFATAHALRDAGIADPMGDARHLVAAALGQGRDRLILLGPEPMPAAATDILADHLRRRIAREPVSRILGQRMFWGRAFSVTPDVLDPRADTETLIAAALDGPVPARLLDLGTGSGAIAITLLAEWPKAEGIATDVSPAALAVAETNARHLAVNDRLHLILSDWCAAITGQFDLILSNPPYIAAAELPDLDPEVLLHDPAIALSPGGDGLAPYRSIAAQAPAHLAAGGRVIVECGWTQAADVEAIFRATGWQGLQVLPDLEGRDRVVIARDPA